MSHASELTGPDLSNGVDQATLVAGKPFLGQVAGEAVMLVRAGARVFASAATCTHYGGPLAEGLVVGNTVRCPWHHACFDLETGLGRGPGLTPVACFDVVQENGLVRVARKRAPYAPAPGSGVGGPASVVIVGGGPAGAACAETLRRHGYGGPVALVADEPPGPVDRPNLSKDYLAGNAPEEWIPLRDLGFYREMKVEFLLGDAAASVDPPARTVTLASGRSMPYGALLLATGAAPRRLDIPGASGPEVRVLRTLADSHAIIAHVAGAGEPRRVVVVGASFIALEVAASLRARQAQVDVVMSERLPLARVFGDKLGAFIQTLHESKGVTFHAERKPARVGGGRVELDDGAVLPADLVVFGVGV
ncbi:MAG: FAD-dependent oxidoreductase, partial [Myxococcales bacterium]|nr:FAD-dependent oxidoreductase [Myxococcales bacterium]